MSKKDAYIEKAKAKIDEQTARLELLKAKAKGEIADQKIKMHDKIRDLESKLETAKSHLGEISNVAEDAWEHLQEKADSITDNIGGSLKKLFGKDDK